MARNRSEKLTSCPEAHAYADAAEKWLLADEPDPLRMPFYYWDNVPHEIRTHINEAATSGKKDGIRGGRKARIAYIREHYAP